MKLTLGFSPCPNDTFIFDALVNHKIDTAGFEFDVVLEDVQTLNEWALAGKLDITKLSFPAFFQSLEYYHLLNCGSALGQGVGPLLITKTAKEISEADVNNGQIILPGMNTTAHLLFSFAYPHAHHKHYLRFDQIEDKVAASDNTHQLNFGVIIHENRFTYADKGLFKVADLGEVWEQKMQVPIPLGGIAIQRKFDKKIALQVDRLIKNSLEYSFKNYPAIAGYVKAHSQAMSEDVMRKHIDLYVNDFSLSLGDEGRNAIHQLRQVFLSLTDNESYAKKEANLFID